MAVGEKHPTPWCGWATWLDNGVVQGVNCEAPTKSEAEQKLKEKVSEVSTN
jgi:hypothetical protein